MQKNVAKRPKKRGKMSQKMILEWNHYMTQKCNGKYQETKRGLYRDKLWTNTKRFVECIETN